jgi:hypothetical protein
LRIKPDLAPFLAGRQKLDELCCFRFVLGAFRDPDMPAPGSGNRFAVGKIWKYMNWLEVFWGAAMKCPL